MQTQSALLTLENIDHSFRSGRRSGRKDERRTGLANLLSLGTVQVLHQVSFEVPRGSVFGFVGANGAGKTTLISLMAGIRRPTKGRIWLNIQGKRFQAHEAAAKQKVGFLPERPYFPEHLTGEGLLRYLGTLSGLSGGRLSSRIDWALKRVGMEHARDRELRKYSKGMLQRVGIAQAILHEPEFLLLDEPMSGLDPSGRKEIRELLTQLHREGHTIFFSSHALEDVDALCDRRVTLEQGRILEVKVIKRVEPLEAKS